VATDTVIVSDRGGTNPRRLPIFGLAASWELSNLCSLSCFANSEDLRATGLGGDLKGKWLTYESPFGSTCRWGGVITSRPVTDGVAEIAALGWAVLLRGRAVWQRARPTMAPPGALARKALQEASREEPHFLTMGQIDESGSPVLVTWGGEDIVQDVLPSLTADGQSDWLVTFERQFRFGRLGTDRSASVRLCEGRHILTYRAPDDLFILANRLVGVGASREGLESMRRGKRKRRKRRTIRDSDEFISAAVEDITSIRKYGPMERVISYSDTRDVGTIQSRLRRELERSANPTIPLEVSLINEDRIFASFSEGDTVTVELGGAGLRGTLRVRVRALDVGNATMRVAGDFRVTT